MRPGRAQDLQGVLELWHSEVRAGRQDCVPGEARLQRLLAGFDWSARSRVIDGARGPEGAVIVADRPTPYGTVTQVSAVADRLDARRDLVRWGLSLSKAAGAIAAQVWIGKGHGDVLTELGAEFVRPWWRMDRSLSGELPAPEPVPGYTLADGNQVALGGWSGVYNGSFADHWRFSPRQESELVTGRPARLSLMAIDEGGSPASVTLGQVEAYVEDSRAQPVGIVSSVGTVPEHRRKGLATWLVAEELHRLREAGARSASLYVDGWNQSRAFDTYRKLGFRVAFESEVWEASFR